MQQRALDGSSGAAQTQTLLSLNKDNMNQPTPLLETDSAVSLLPRATVTVARPRSLPHAPGRERLRTKHSAG
jgi:hypothetical protein